MVLEYIPIRYVFAVLGSIGIGITYGLKVNLSIAMVGMINNTALDILAGEELNSSLPKNGSGESALVAEDGPFIWSGTLQGIILSSYFCGYIFAQLPGGRIAELYSAKWVFFGSVAINVVCTALTPISAKLHYSVLVVMRTAEGLAGGVSFPAMHVMIARWAPLNELTVISSVVYTGSSLGTVLSILLSGLIASEVSWEAVFYIMAAASAIWLFLWPFFVTDRPDQHPFITENEESYIMNFNKIKPGKSKSSVPWRAVATSMPFWAILIAHTCSNWGWYMVLIELPMYMKQILQFKIAENAFLTSLPFFTLWLYTLIFSKVMDELRSRGIITTTFARKLATVISSGSPATCFLILCFIPNIKVIGASLMTIAITLKGALFCGFLTNHIDIAPNYAGTLVALTNTVATVPGIVVPIFVGKLTDDSPTIESWRIVFFTTVALYVVEIVVYTVFASGEEQEWNRYED